MEVVPANKNMLSANVTMVESLFYSPHVKLIMLFDDYKEGFLKSCDPIIKGFKVRI